MTKTIFVMCKNRMFLRLFTFPFRMGGKILHVLVSCQEMNLNIGQEKKESLET